MLRQVLSLGSIVFLATLSVSAQTTSAPAPNPLEQRRSLTGPTVREPLDPRVEQALRERDAIIRNLLERVQQLEDRLNAINTSSSGPSSSAARVARIAETTAAPSSSRVEAVVNNATYDETERRATESLDQALVVRGGLLLPPGTLEIDNTTSYFSASSDHVTVDGFALLPILVVGDITSQRVREDILLPTFTTRLGLPKRFQMDFTIPYGYVLNRTVDALGKETSASQFGLGDIQAGISRQLTFEHGRMPDLLANIRFKSVTGTNSYDLASSQTNLGSGFYAVQGNLTAAKSSDPVVFFGNLSYTENLAGRHTIPSNDPNNPGGTEVGHFRPGSSYGFQLGSILALNTETSMTLGWDQRFTRATQLNGASLPGSYLVEGTLRLGTSYLYAPGRTIDLSFGVGLTPDTPNLQFSVGLPFRLSLWKPKVVR
ncbi:MAG TPA: transporter [Edaphobacter sp.]|uniref:transporter n=1 Tax=Edaphobacter sp. TaxID=1934404 RepID=UPI002CE09520|nr:transporter [Edaphobacter sp.]HUZ97347.1 transporter [Edaphobacter sp.]